VEAQTDIQTQIDQGNYSLAHGQAREAAIAYANAAQLDSNNPAIHLGLAEANLALGNNNFVTMAAQRVQELQPEGGIESITAQALLDVLAHQYDRALQKADTVIAQNPGIAYVHALRSYLLRLNHQDYDANLARARSARLAYGGRFDGVFPPAEPQPYPTTSSYNTGYSGLTTDATQTTERTQEVPQQRNDVPTWSRPNSMQRQMVRTRFALSQYQSLVTYLLIAINVVVYVFSLLNPSLVEAGAQINPLVAQGEYWRLFTAMFLHASPLHIGFNMLSLFFVGRAIEIYYGKLRYLLIYLLSGIAGGILYFFTSPGGAAVGASGAIFGVFGALGVFYIVNRRSIGGGAIGNWVFWIGLNLVFGLANPDIALFAHIGGLIAGMLIAFPLTPRIGNRRIY
jgi:membrane associated rhomboid family serine protease